MAEKKALEEKLIQLAKGANLLKVPVYFSEQYPEGLGKTISAIRSASKDAAVWTKTKFSAGEFVEKIPAKHILLAGVETHICIRQTAYDLRENGKTVSLVVDAIGSRHAEDRNVSLQEMHMDRFLFTTVETVLFELMEDAKHPQFKEISALIKQPLL